MRNLWRDDIPRTTDPIRFFFFISKPHARVAVAATLFVIAASILRAVIPFIYKLIVDAATTVGTGSYDPLWYAVLLFIAVSLTANLLFRGSGFAGSHWLTGIRATGRAALTSYLTLHSHQYFSDRFAGSLSNKVKQAADGAKEIGEAYL